GAPFFPPSARAKREARHARRITVIAQHARLPLIAGLRVAMKLGDGRLGRALTAGKGLLVPMESTPCRLRRSGYRSRPYIGMLLSMAMCCWTTGTILPAAALSAGLSPVAA